ncbi:MAG: biotin/lipoyl-containing protein [Candidatus Woesearchaeota archaeon]
MGIKEYENCKIVEKGNVAEIGFKNDPKSIEKVKSIIFLEIEVKPGDYVKKGDILLKGEIMKGTFELESRIEGKVIDVNREAEENPEILNSKPDQWLVKVGTKK